jgi:SAM-dependent methyltransferase
MLIFVDPAHFLSPEREKARYATHENGIKNEGYVAFLYRLLRPMLPLLDAKMRGLDYGSGPGPTLSVLARQHGIACEDYDPFFANRPLHPPYDFIFSTECFEHFHQPAKEFQRIHDLLKPGGLLGIMTEHWTTLPAFAEWYYTKDPTHVSFYHANTFDFACNRFEFKSVWRDDKRVVILRRHSAAT